MENKKIVYITEEKGFTAGFGYNCLTIRPVEVKEEDDEKKLNSCNNEMLHQ